MAASKRSAAHRQDDLTQISGIGVARQRWLRETMGVRTYDDLAALDPAALESTLREEGKIIAPGDIQVWIEQARELTVIQTSPHSGPEVPGDAWHPVASFVVEYQQQGGDAALYRTRVHQMETGESKTFSGVAFGPVCEWIEAHSGLKAEVEAPAAEALVETLPEAFNFSPRLQKVLEKAGMPNAVASPTPAAPTIAAAPPPSTGAFSDRLQALVERSRRA
jgi:hypothetical protein